MPLLLPLLARNKMFVFIDTIRYLHLVDLQVRSWHNDAIACDFLLWRRYSQHMILRPNHRLTLQLYMYMFMAGVQLTSTSSCLISTLTIHYCQNAGMSAGEIVICLCHISLRSQDFKCLSNLLLVYNKQNLLLEYRVIIF